MRGNQIKVLTTPEVVGRRSECQFHLLPNPSSCRISSTSCWSDSIWRLDRDIGLRSHESTINWEFPLEDGSHFTDARHALLLDTFKRFIWSAVVDSRGGGAWSYHSFATRASTIKRIVRWMVKYNYFTLAMIDPNAVSQFTDDLVEELQSDGTLLDDAALLEGNSESDLPDEAIFENDDQYGEESDEEIGFASLVCKCLVVWQKLWYQSPALKSAGLPGIEEDPLRGQSARSLTLQLTTWVIKRIPPLPDEVAIPVMNEAHRWLGCRADDVIRLHNMYMDALAMRDIVSKQTVRLHVVRNIPSFTFSVEHDESEPWHPEISPSSTFSVDGNVQLQVPTDAVRDLVEKVAAACSIVIQSETGMRVSELAAIESGVDENSGLPKALATQLSKTGLNQLFFIRSTLIKTVKSPKLEEWLAGSCPVGSSFTPGPIRAIQILEALFEPWRRISEDARTKKALFIVARGSGLSVNPGVFAAARTYSLRIKQKWFIQECVDLAQLPDQSRLGEDLALYRETAGHCIQTHQWRKTFAMYVVRTDPRMVPAIALQFKHLSVAMTESAYISKDPSLMREYSAQQARAAATFFYRAITGKDTVAGRMARLIDEWRATLLERIGAKSATGAIDILQELCESRNIRAFTSPHGKCFIRVRPSEARCHQQAGSHHWANKKPNYDHREPDVCNGCACFGVDPDHIPYWEQRFTENQTAWLKSQAQGLQQGFRVVQERALQSANMLRALGVELPDIKIKTHA